MVRLKETQTCIPANIVWERITTTISFTPKDPPAWNLWPSDRISPKDQSYIVDLAKEGGAGVRARLSGPVEMLIIPGGGPSLAGCDAEQLLRASLHQRQAGPGVIEPGPLQTIAEGVAARLGARGISMSAHVDLCGGQGRIELQFHAGGRDPAGMASMRLGRQLPLVLRWYQYGVAVGPAIHLRLDAGDIYCLSEWSPSNGMTLREGRYVRQQNAPTGRKKKIREQEQRARRVELRRLAEEEAELQRRRAEVEAKAKAEEETEAAGHEPARQDDAVSSITGKKRRRIVCSSENEDEDDRGENKRDDGLARHAGSPLCKRRRKYCGSEGGEEDEGRQEGCQEEEAGRTLGGCWRGDHNSP